MSPRDTLHFFGMAALAGVCVFFLAMSNYAGLRGIPANFRWIAKTSPILSLQLTLTLTYPRINIFTIGIIANRDWNYRDNPDRDRDNPDRDRDNPDRDRDNLDNRDYPDIGITPISG